MTTPLALSLQKAVAHLEPNRGRVVEAWTRELAEVAPAIAPDLRAYCEREIGVLFERLGRGELEAFLTGEEQAAGEAARSGARFHDRALALGALHRASVPALVAATTDRESLADGLVALHELGDRRLEILLRAQDAESAHRLLDAQELAAQSADKARELARVNDALRRSEAESRHRAAQIGLLSSVAHRISSILDPERLMQEAAETVQARMNHTYVAVVVLDDEGVLVGRWAGRQGVGRRSSGRTQGPAGGVIGRALRKRAPQVVADVSKDPDYHADVPGTCAEMVIPLLDGGEIVGAIDFQTERPGAFDLDAVAVGETLAEFLVVALRNARLFSEARRARG